MNQLTSLLTVAALAPAAAFAPSLHAPSTVALTSASASSLSNNRLARERNHEALFAAGDGEASEAIFVAPDADDDTTDDAFEKAEALGKGAAKAKRGRRKGSEAKTTSTATKSAAALAPEETFYEGPPAITETIVPTISILTVVGIIPAAAAWARQAWVRYRITSRRIRVNSGIGGKEMAEIVYPDIVELRTVKRLFGDGDMVVFLRDGAKFEMRNIPNFEETMNFVCDQLDDEVAATYRKKGDVTNP